MKRLQCLWSGHRWVPHAMWVLPRENAHRDYTLALWSFRRCDRCGEMRFRRDSGQRWVFGRPSGMAS